jgi:signal transduction histidine kinase
MFAIARFSLVRKFMVVSFLILFLGMLIIGVLLSTQIKNGVINQTSAITALYVDSFISPILQELPNQQSLTEEQLSELNGLLTESDLSEQIVTYKIWMPDGRIVYSPKADLIGRFFPNDEVIQLASSGAVSSKLTTLDKPEHEYERQFWDQLIETYAPIHADNNGEVIAISEFYQLPDNLNNQILSAQLQIWLVVGVSTLVMYLMLTGMFGQASNTILHQQEELNDQVLQLTELLAQNQKLHGRLKRAASRTTTLNEQFLHRISSDLHDGPIQDLALALLRLESVTDAFGESSPKDFGVGDNARDIDVIQKALKTSLKEIRLISSGLRIPDLVELTPSQVAKRAVHDYQYKTNQQVEINDEDSPLSASEPVKITLFRVLQEALYNGYQHAMGKGQSVRIWEQNHELFIEVMDRGEGFDPSVTSDASHLGIAGMRERVKVLGGGFYIGSANGNGTRILANLPLDIEVPDA